MTTTIPEQYQFIPGKAYPVRDADGIDDYLTTALQAERYISHYQIDTPDGTYWSTHPDTPIDLTYYSGVAGLSLFYQKLFVVTGEQRFDRIAKQGFDFVAKHWQEAINTKTMTHDTSALPSYQLGGAAGIGGIGESLLFAYHTYGNVVYADAAKDIGHFYERHAHQDENGLSWTGSIAISFDGGALLFLLALYETFPEQWLHNLIVNAGNWYLSQGHRTSEGYLRFNGLDGRFDFELPNFGYGSAGAGFVLLKLFDTLHEDRYLAAAKDVARYLDSIKLHQTHGYLIPYRIGLNEEPFFYLGNCHGPAGTARFFYHLYQVTNDVQYLSFINGLVDGFEALGAPEHESKGLWNSVCLCCGHAGILHFFISLYLAHPDERWKQLSRRTARILLGYAEHNDDDSADWPEAWERTKSDELSRRIGYSDGTAGIATSLLELYTLEKGTYDWPRFIDDPFPSHLSAESQEG